MPEVQIPKAFQPLFKPARYKAFYGGRGSAKSHSMALALVIMATQRPMRILCCREIQRSIKDSVKRLLDDKIAALGLEEHFQSLDNEIRGKNGSLFMFAGLRTNPDTIKSMEAIDVAWIEEAHTVSENSLQILIPTVRRPGSEIWLSWNPRHETDPVDRRFRSDEPLPGSVVRQVTYADNPWFPDVLREEMEWDKKRDPDKYAHIWLGKYQRRTNARVFHNWTVEECEPPADARLYFGADWGFSNDPTVLIRCWVDGRTLYIDQEAYKIGCEIDQTPELFRQVPGADKWPITADSARPETISYMRREGFNIHASKKGRNSVEEGVEFLKSFDIVVHPRCRHTIDELSLYSYEVDKQTEDVLPKLADKHNHVIDSCIAEGALVTTYKGDVPIEDVRVGDHVLTRKGYRRVDQHVLTRKSASVMRIETKHGTLDLTPDHLIWTDDHGFIRADALSVGDMIKVHLPDEGTTLSVEAGVSYPIKWRKDVYDIAVDGEPEFFANGILVHNCRYAVESLRRSQSRRTPKLALMTERQENWANINGR